MSAAGFIVTYLRYSVMDFSVQYYNDPLSILIPYPTIDSTVNGIVRPFQYDVKWIDKNNLNLICLTKWNSYTGLVMDSRQLVYRSDKLVEALFMGIGSFWQEKNGTQAFVVWKFLVFIGFSWHKYIRWFWLRLMIAQEEFSLHKAYHAYIETYF